MYIYTHTHTLTHSHTLTTLQTCRWKQKQLPKLSDFGRVRQIAKSDCYIRHVCRCVLMEQLGSHWTDFHEILISEDFPEKSVQKIQVSLKSDNNNGYIT
jgi:hypothetical protein